MFHPPSGPEGLCPALSEWPAFLKSGDCCTGATHGPGFRTHEDSSISDGLGSGTLTNLFPGFLKKHMVTICMGRQERYEHA